MLSLRGRVTSDSFFIFFSLIPLSLSFLYLSEFSKFFTTGMHCSYSQENESTLNERVACRVFGKQFPICLVGRKVKYGAFYHHVGVEYAAHGGDEVVSRYSNMYLLSRHRHIHDSELYEEKFTLKGTDATSSSWFLQ